jgi:N-succinyldiaminopimelate aminotransferase
VSVSEVPIPLVERMREFGTTIFAEMSALAVATGSINLGQGFPDTDGPGVVLEAAVEAIRSGKHNQYPPGLGVPELRNAIARHQQRFYGLDYDPATEILVTAGATEAIAAAILSLTEPGDEVVVFEPYYDSYPACIALAGARRRTVTLRHTGDRWAFDAEELRQAISPRTRLILLNTPHNPTGKVFDGTELKLIADLAVERDLIVVTDEVYEHLIFDGRAHLPLAGLPGMRHRTVAIGSGGKTLSVTGWKIGWACAPPALIAAIRTVKQFLTYVNGGPFQPAVAIGLDQSDEFFAQIAETLQGQRDLLCGGLADLGYDVIVPEATYFATVDVHSDAIAYCRRLPQHHRVVAIPTGVFYDSDAGDNLVRFAFCKQATVLAEALSRLKDVER